MPTLRVNITGISCLIDPPPNSTDLFRKRVLLPTDTIFSPDFPPHIPHVEIAELDLVDPPESISGLSEQYSRDGVAYRRFDLSGHRLRLANVATDQEWWVSSQYNDHVIKMTEVAPFLPPQPTLDCFADFPATSLVSGHFDMSHGRLSVSAFDSPYTIFFGTPTWPKRRLAVSSILDVDVTDSQPSFWIEHASHSGAGTLVRLKADNVGISIGNLPLSEIFPEEGQETTDNFPHDFQIFYGLAVAGTVPPNPPLPSRPAGLQIACSNTNWP